MLGCIVAQSLRRGEEVGFLARLVFAIYPAQQQDAVCSPVINVDATDVVALEVCDLAHGIPGAVIIGTVESFNGVQERVVGDATEGLDLPLLESAEAGRGARIG